MQLLKKSTKTRKAKRKTPAKSNGCLLEQIQSKTYLFTIDWLTLNLQGKPKTKHENYTFEFADYGNRTFKQIVKISNGNEAIGTLAFEKRSTTIQI